ncbi:MAG: DUF6624 domain-containing protein [Sediminibacterium sp.]
MLNKFGITYYIICSCFGFHAQNKTVLQFSLDSILKLDQYARNQIDHVIKDLEFQDSVLTSVGMSLPQFLQQTMENQAIQDEQNLKWVTQFIEQNGYPGKTLVGEKYAEVAWSVLQHSDQNTLKKFLPLIKETSLEGEIDPLCYAKSKDRVLIGDKRAQLYGTQLYFDPKNQIYGMYKIRFKKRVDKRRESIGLVGIESYLYFNFQLVYEQLDVVKP